MTTPFVRKRLRPLPKRSASPANLRLSDRPDLVAFPGAVELRSADPPSVPGAEMSSPLADVSSIRSLLAPLDGSPFAEHALPMALAIARRSGARIRLLHVHQESASPFNPYEFPWNSGFNYYLKNRQKSYLRGVLKRVAAISSAHVTPSLREANHPPAAAIAAEVRSGADLVIMATHRRTRLGRWWRRSVAEAMLRQISAPLLLVRGRDAPPELDDEPPLQRILIPHDGSAQTDEALRLAVEIGGLMNAACTLLRVVSPSSEPEKMQQALRELRATANRLECGGARVEIRLARGEDVAKTILWHAQVYRSDLVVLAARERGAFARGLQMSTAEAVTRNFETPVLIVPCRT